MPKMTIVCGWGRETLVEREVTIVGGGVAGEIDCLECGGSGWWDFGPTEEENGPCIQCKGTGRELVSI